MLLFLEPNKPEEPMNLRLLVPTIPAPAALLLDMAGEDWRWWVREMDAEAEEEVELSLLTPFVPLARRSVRSTGNGDAPR
jgi:hypothetical protein